MSFYKTIRPILFLVKPEIAHKLALRSLSIFARIFPISLPMPERDDYILKQDLFGLTFSNPLGLAAGFDKNGEAIDGVLKIGFGFIEIGTVTPEPQNGQPHPRLFRLKNSQAIINRLGFNNQGHEAVRTRLSRRMPMGIIGVNIGANKNTNDRILDYETGAQVFGEYASYLTVNVSSPNTPGLRDLQARKPLSAVLKKVKQAVPKTPIFLKIAPDLDDAQLADMAETALKAKITGLIVSNTTTARDGVMGEKHADEAGGLSGKPLMEASTEMLGKARRLTQGQLVLIGVGGIASAQDAYAKIRAGASLVQLYSALTYQGVGMVSPLKRALSNLLRADGFTNISEAVGVDVALDALPSKSVAKKKTVIKLPHAKLARAKPSKTKASDTLRVTIYHNPRCSKSRQTLALLKERGQKIKVVEYLKEPLSVDEIRALLKKLKIPPAALIRKGEQMFKTLKLTKESDAAKLIAAMAQHPILIERPIVVKGRRAVLARPADSVLDIL